MAGSVETYKRVVVEGNWDGDVTPGALQELRRQIFVKPGARVRGSILGHEVRIEGPAQVSQAVYASKDLEIFPYGTVRIGSGIGAKELLVVHPDQDWTVIEGDVVGRNLRLSNCAVIGSISGDEVRLENVACLGVVQGSQLLELRRSTVLTTAGQNVIFHEGCGIVLPFARADRQLELRAPVTYVGVDAEDSSLDEFDVIVRDGRKYLTAGRRLTDLGQVRGQLENISNFLLNLTMRDSIRALPDRMRFNPKALPEPFASLVELEGGRDVVDQNEPA